METNQKSARSFLRMIQVWLGVVLFTALTPMCISADEWVYATRPGDNLWSITQKYLTGIQYWRPLQKLNEIERPRNIPPGTRLRMPIAWSKVQDATARILTIEGKVEYIEKRTGERGDATVGQLLMEGDEIITRQESNVLLEFTDGTRLLLHSGSQLRMDKLDAFGDGDVGDTEINIDKGRAAIHVNPSKLPWSRFEISTPSALTSVRGTRFRATADSSGSESRFEVVEGKVEVSNEGKSIALNQGYGTLSKKGIPPIAPIKLLPPPDKAGMPRLVEEIPFSFELPPLTAAIGYRLQIAVNEKFDILLFDQRVNSNNIVMSRTDLADGDYAMRIRGIDDQGIEGYDATIRFTLNARPEAPFLMEPQANAAVAGLQSGFRWARPELAESYRIQLAANDRFDRPLLDEAGLSDERFSLDQPLKQGSYYWRVTAYDAEGKPGPIGHPQQFLILPPAPAARAPVLDEQGLTFNWPKGEPGQRIHFQLSKDKDFSSTQVDELLDEPNYKMPLPEPGIYYVRVKTIDTDGVEGSFGTVQSVTVPGPDRSWIVLVPLGLMILLVL